MDKLIIQLQKKEKNWVEKMLPLLELNNQLHSITLNSKILFKLIQMLNSLFGSNNNIEIQDLGHTSVQEYHSYWTGLKNKTR